MIGCLLEDVIVVAKMANAQSLSMNALNAAIVTMARMTRLKQSERVAK